MFCDRLSDLLQREGIRGNVEDLDTEEKVDLVVDGVNKVLDRAVKSVFMTFYCSS